MPTYDYVCKACGHRFEEFQSMSADPLKKCPQCNKNKLERLIGTGAGGNDKGAGDHETDDRGDSYAADPNKDAEAAPAAAPAAPELALPIAFHITGAALESAPLFGNWLNRFAPCFDR